jgi:PAS domain S-box-containing protein
MTPFEVANYIDDLVLLVDQDGRVKWANRVFLQRKNISLIQVQGQDAFHLLNGDQKLDFTVNQLQQVIAADQPLAFSAIFHSVDQFPSSVNWISQACAEIENHAVLVGRWNTNADQNSETNKPNEHDAARYYQTLSRNSAFFIVRIDMEGKYSYVNRFFASVMGYPEEELVGRHSFETIVDEDRDKCNEVVMQCFANPGKPFAIALRKPSKNGIIYNQWEFTALTNDDGVPQEIFCIGYEITPLLERQQELLKLAQITNEQNERLTQFTHIVSHNLRSHVSNIKGLMEITDIEDKESLAKNWGMLKQASASLEATLRSLNEVISISTTGPSSFKQVNAMEMLELVKKSLQSQIDQTKAILETSGNLNQWLMVVPAYFESILFNLISNALKYRHPDRTPEVNISIENRGNDCIIQVSDNGLGLDLNRYGKKLFGMYKTFHGNSDARGVGLFITKTQVESMGGNIAVASTPGIGTTFTITLHEQNIAYTSH